MTTIEKRNAAKSRKIAIIGTVLFHIVLISYMFYASSGEGESLIEIFKNIMPESTPAAHA